MKHFKGCIPPVTIVLLLSAYCYAQGNGAIAATPAADITTVLTGIGTGGLTIWFCLKWVQSELDRAKESKEGQDQKHKDEIEKLNLDWRNKFEEIERRWRHDYTNMIAMRDAEKELRIQSERDYADRLRDLTQQISNQNQMLLDGVRTLAQVQIERDKSGNQT